MFSSDVMVDVIGGGWVGRDTFVILKIGKVFFVVVGKLSVALIPGLKISVCIMYYFSVNLDGKSDCAHWSNDHKVVMC